MHALSRSCCMPLPEPQALEKYNIEKDIAAFIKKEFDKKYNPTWHCIVGRNFGEREAQSRSASCACAVPFTELTRPFFTPFRLVRDPRNQALHLLLSRWVLARGTSQPLSRSMWSPAEPFILLDLPHHPLLCLLLQAKWRSCSSRAVKHPATAGPGLIASADRGDVHDDVAAAMIL